MWVRKDPTKGKKLARKWITEEKIKNNRRWRKESKPNKERIKGSEWADMEVTTESLDWSSWNSITCYPRLPSFLSPPSLPFNTFSFHFFCLGPGTLSLCLVFPVHFLRPNPLLFPHHPLGWAQYPSFIIIPPPPGKERHKEGSGWWWEGRRGKKGETGGRE